MSAQDVVIQQMAYFVEDSVSRNIAYLLVFDSKRTWLCKFFFGGSGNLHSTRALDSSFFKVNDKFKIYDGNFKLLSDSQVVQLNGAIEFYFYPKPTIRFLGEAEKVNIHALMDEKDIILEVPGMLPTKASLDLVQNNYVIKGMVLYQIKDDKDFYMDSYYMHVNNFVNYLGDNLIKGNFYNRGGITIEYEDWKLNLQLRHDYKDKRIFPNLKDRNGHGITHIIKMEKRDGSKFKKSEVSEIEEIFVWIFTLCAGRHIGIPIKIGEDQEGNEYREFSVPLMSPFREVPNWFPKQKGTVIENLFHKLASKLNDEFIKRIIKETIHWYVETLNAIFIENKIINSQIALEKLSFVLLTQQTPQIISKTKFDKNNFQTNLETILDELSIKLFSVVNLRNSVIALILVPIY
ncbi:hypothetical protein GCM10011391_38770 [Pullulanibacillus camelliae]|uniref:YopA central domain-containing protein n=1 Tax=Pullulanibacillus camelliae TaxID=1707096 RepID=A0A8J2YNJ0_9BACL|nr:hypothetical protein [Pullulanibacillus camelliae]GGE56002.1 hypothetical protein GCM10011391_38770 [Pullulanibacillus camelliae]